MAGERSPRHEIIPYMSFSATAPSWRTNAVGPGARTACEMKRGALAAVLLFSTQGGAVVFNRKILLLPGSSSSAGAFLNMPTGASPLIGAAKATYHDGGRLAWLFEAIDPPTPSGEWFCPGGTADGADESIAAVEAALEDGGFVGLVGFDDGAALASLVAARAALGDGRTTSLQFAVLCTALTPTPTLTLTRTQTRT